MRVSAPQKSRDSGYQTIRFSAANCTMPRRTPPLLSYMRLFRLPNVFTAVADVMMGYLLVHGSLQPGLAFGCLLATTCLLYTAGMVLNDVYDVDEDRRERPERPLPAGDISVAWAKWLGFELLLTGVALGWLAGYAVFGVSAFPWRSGAVATVLAACVFGYDRGLKVTAIGPAMMGACRGLNVLLGMSLAPVGATGSELLCGFNWPQLVLASGLGVYVAGITWYARTEAGDSTQRQLAAGAAVMALGIGLFSAFPFVGQIADVPAVLKPGWWWLLLSVPAFTVLRRSFTAALNPSPAAVQIAVKQALITLIVFDAAATLMVRGPLWAMGVLVLLAPTLILGRWVYST